MLRILVAVVGMLVVRMSVTLKWQISFYLITFKLIVLCVT